MCRVEGSYSLSQHLVTDCFSVYVQLDVCFTFGLKHADSVDRQEQRSC